MEGLQEGAESNWMSESTATIAELYLSFYEYVLSPYIQNSYLSIQFYNFSYICLTSFIDESYHILRNIFGIWRSVSIDAKQDREVRRVVLTDKWGNIQ
jgi:hypothetical protein